MCINIYLGLFAGPCWYDLHGFGIDLTGEMGERKNGRHIFMYGRAGIRWAVCSDGNTETQSVHESNIYDEDETN